MFTGKPMSHGTVDPKYITFLANERTSSYRLYNNGYCPGSMV